MRYYQNLQFQMLSNVALLLKKHKNDLSESVPALEEIIDDYVEWMDQLFRIKSGSRFAVGISAGQKKNIREKLENAILKLTGVLRAHQYKNRNKAVDKNTEAGANESTSNASLAGHTISALKKATAENLYHICEQVISGVKKIKTIRQYGLTADDMKEAEACFKEYAKLRNAPAQSKKDTATRNGELVLGIKEAIANLENTIDPLMRIAAQDDKELYGRYKGFRKVMAKGKGRLSEKEAAYRKSRKRKRTANR